MAEVELEAAHSEDEDGRWRVTRGYSEVSYGTGRKFHVPAFIRGQKSQYIGNYNTEEKARQAAINLYAEHAQHDSRAAKASETKGSRVVSSASSKGQVRPYPGGKSPYKLPRMLPAKSGLQRGYHYCTHPNSGKLSWRVMIMPLHGYEQEKQRRPNCPPGSTEQQAADMAMEEFCRLHKTTVQKVQTEVAAIQQNLEAASPPGPAQSKPSLVQKTRASGQAPKRKSSEAGADNAAPCNKRPAPGPALPKKVSTVPARKELSHLPMAGSTPSQEARGQLLLPRAGAAAQQVQPSGFQQVLPQKSQGPATKQDLSAASEQLEEHVLCVSSYLDLVKLRLKQAGKITGENSGADLRGSIDGRLEAAEDLGRVAVQLKCVLAELEDSLL
ncbi:hypothetical protein WJX73_007061 [Symbiochloris irregularis]|uniref:AP2/ERF domain-containing protein n=1 Tax=Symbiochloris irregularis TaxID=706552 RepID=A0AAW1PIJ4_9CHLO